MGLRESQVLTGAYVILKSILVITDLTHDFIQFNLGPGDLCVTVSIKNRSNVDAVNSSFQGQDLNYIFIHCFK